MAASDSWSGQFDSDLIEILSQYKLVGRALSRKCTEQTREHVFLRLRDWQTFAYFLGLSQETIVAIEREKSTESQRKIALYEKWICRNGSKATYKTLAEALYRHGRLDLIELMCKKLKVVQENAVVQKVVKHPTTNEIASSLTSG